jgi:hypothetical protein
LTTNDPYAGVKADQGILSFRMAEEKTGLRVTRVAAPPIVAANASNANAINI